MEKAYKPCHVASCGNLTQERYCSQHEHLMSSRSRRASIEWHDWYRSTRYRAARFKFMARHPWCATPGCGHVATTLDHIVPHRGNRSLFWDEGNWQALCKRCHDVKTMTDDASSRRTPGVGQNVLN